MRKPASVDDRDFLDMLLAEAKENEELSVLSESTADTIWEETQTETEEGSRNE